MPCFHPWRGYRRVFPATGLTYNASEGGQSLTLPCGQCIGCRMQKSQDWATRIVHEAAMHDASSFVTLTYTDDNLPSDGSVSLRPVQLFLKKLRNSVGRVRYFAVGEYGDQLLRPHYHMIIFGHSFPDKTIWRKSPSGHYLYRSAALEHLWPYGQCEIGTVTVQSAGYVARYCIKKITGDRATSHYSRIDPVTGVVTPIRPEFICMSTRPGLGYDWYDRFRTDCFPSDFVVIDGRKRSVPAYYTRKLKSEGLQGEADALDSIGRKALRASKHEANNTPQRLAVREEVQLLRVKQLPRKLETNG